MAFLQVDGLDAWYGKTQVLFGCDITLDEGGVIAVLGANGAGKTTLLRALSGMVRRQGRIVIDGTPADQLSPEAVVRLGVAHVPEGRGTFGRLTVEENLRLAAIIRKDAAGVRRDFTRVYDYFPRLHERRSQQAGTLSGGEQQMLAIGRALMLAPKLMLLDEPSFGLAPQVRRDIFLILKDISRSSGVSMLVVEQNAALALDLASHAYLLETGRIVLSGTADSFLADDTVRRTYLGY
ncbi:MAG: ABC transporter ATP-binding protein [Rhodobacteraceae bacterium]|jgi:branched-chain amino acid transport system ATP-binding protein|nr:ABC transporter ATP-binding protein [Paracoccaceae bacterium]